MQLTEKHLAHYRKCISLWAPKLGLTGWRIDVDWCKKHEEGGDLGYVKYNCSGRNATITLNKEWTKEDDPSNAHINEVAFHECLHLVLADLCDLVEQNCPKAILPVMMAQEHNVIRTLENVYFRTR